MTSELVTEAAQPVRGADLLVDALIAAEVDVLFGVPGDTGVVFYDALSQRGDEIQHVLARDERHAAAMADGYARSSNKVGVVEVSSGGGTTYVVGGLGEAYASGVPMLLVTSDIHASSRGTGALTEIDQEALFSAVTKGAFTLEKASELPGTITRAITLAASGRPGPVAVIVPENLLDAPTTARAVPVPRTVPAVREGAAPQAVTKAAAALTGAGQPAILAGAGIHRSDAYAELADLAEALGAGVATSIHGKGTIATSSPWSLGVIGNNGGHPGGNAFVADADVVLLVGTRANATDTNGWTSPARYGPTVIQIDIDEGRAGRNFPGSLPLVGDAKLVLNQLLDAVSRVESGTRQNRLDRITRARQTPVASHGNAVEADHERDGKLLPSKIMRALHAELGPDTVLTADPGTPTPNVAAYWDLEKPGRTILIPRGHGPMGYAIPAAIGASWDHPGKPVLSLTADGSFAMACGELETAARFSLPILFVQFTNHSMGWIKMLQHLYTEQRYFGVDPGSIDAVGVAEASGLEALRPGTMEEFTQAVASFAARPRPLYLDVDVPHMIELTPPVPAWFAALEGDTERPVY